MVATIVHSIRVETKVENPFFLKEIVTLYFWSDGLVTWNDNRPYLGGK